jgi:hypothetical protein
VQLYGPPYIEATHKKIKNYFCHVCNYSSYFKQDLKLHSNIVHRGLREFKCEHCDKAFPRKDRLASHLTSFHIFNCDTCDKSFPSKGLLSDHVMDERSPRFKIQHSIRAHVVIDPVHGQCNKVQVMDVPKNLDSIKIEPPSVLDHVNEVPKNLHSIKIPKPFDTVIIVEAPKPRFKIQHSIRAHVVNFDLVHGQYNKFQVMDVPKNLDSIKIEPPSILDHEPEVPKNLQSIKIPKPFDTVIIVEPHEIKME